MKKLIFLLYFFFSVFFLYAQQVISITGKVTEASATTMRGTALAEAAVRIMMSGPKWHPASQYGRPVIAYRLQPITIGPSN